MTRGVSRRGFLGLTGAAVAVGALGAAGFAGRDLLRPGQPGLVLPSQAPLPVQFEVPLPVPPVLRPTSSTGTTDYYDVVQQVADLEILPGLRTEAWTYGGTFPGPTIVSRSGRRAVVRHRNELPQPTVVHLHGGHTPAESDGYPMDLILPAGSAADGAVADGAAGAHTGHADGAAGSVVGQRDYTYPMEQRAATLWYHDHRHGFTGPAVWRGLAGFHLVHDDAEDDLHLPVGDRDIPLMITDRSFAADGGFHYPLVDPSMEEHGVQDPYMDGVLGDVVLVNGAPWPALEVDRVRYRLRFLNGSNARRYRLVLDPQPSGGGALVQVGGDGGLLARPIAHDAVDIAPAERFDVVVDFARFAPGTRVRLLNRLGEGRTTEVMCFDVSSARAEEDAQVPERLSSIEVLDLSRATTTRTFQFQLGAHHGWTINGEPYRPGRPLARPRLGDIEIWRFITDVHHPVHVHLDPFQVVSRNNRPPGPYDAGWKDTVDVRPAEGVEVAVRFTDYAGAFMLHCHNLEHEDMAMMADFVTV
jgi:spore coat protein A